MRTKSGKDHMLIQLGQILVTQGVVKTFTSKFQEDCILRHMTGDFGDLDQEDLRTNQKALVSNGRLLSVYKQGSEALWIITEAGGQVTTLLLPSEY